MKEIDLYRFIADNGVDLRWDDDVLSCWIPHYILDEFTSMISQSYFDDGAIDAALTSGGFVWVDLVPICEYHGIEPEKVFAKQN